MKILLSITSIVLLGFANHVSAQTSFENPDGNPHSIAIEPLFEYSSGGPFDTELYQLGLGVIVPVSERVTIRASGNFGSGDYFKPDVDLYQDPGGDLWAVNGIKRAEYEQIDVRLSVRIWLGSGRKS